MTRTQTMMAGLGMSAALLLAGCNGGVEGQPSPTGSSGGQSPLASLDPCAALTAEQLQANGNDTQGEPMDQGGESGCEFMGEPFILAIYRGEDHGRAYWEKRRDNFAVFETNRVGQHQGIRMVTKGSVDQGICNQIILAGGGSVTVQATTTRATGRESSKPCNEALEIAEQVEPRLPE